MKYLYFLSIFLIIFSNCSKTNNLPIKEAVKIDSSAYYPDIIDTANFELYDYFEQALIERYNDEIVKFQKVDSLNFPEKNIILFVGSSSFRMWSTLLDDMQPLDIIKRGFGGSTIPEIIYYAEIIVFQYEPSVVVFYCGENDHLINTSKEIYETFQYFEKKFHSHFPKSTLYYLSIKPSPARETWWKKMSLTNRFIKYYCNLQDNTEFIDITPLMFNEDKTINKNLFLSDNLHLNSEGYALWTKKIKSVLENKN